MKTQADGMIEQTKQFIREPCAWPGGYPKVLVMNDGGCLCSECAKSEFKQIVYAIKHALRDGWQAEGISIHYEGEPIVCDHCSVEIESAYGVPETA